MCRLIAFALLGTAVVLLVGTVLLFTFLPPGTSLFVLFVLFLLISASARWVFPFLARRAAAGFGKRILFAKAAALRGAQVDIHSIERLPTPEHPEVDAEAIDHDRDPSTPDIDILTPHDYFAIELTITPAGPRRTAQSTQTMTPWEPSELILAGHPPISFTGKQPRDTWQPDRVELIRDGQRLPDDIGKYAGPQRLRLYVSLPHYAPRSLTLWYYTEALGIVELPR